MNSNDGSNNHSGIVGQQIGGGTAADSTMMILDHFDHSGNNNDARDKANLNSSATFQQQSNNGGVYYQDQPMFPNHQQAQIHYPQNIYSCHPQVSDPSAGQHPPGMQQAPPLTGMVPPTLPTKFSGGVGRSFDSIGSFSPPVGSLPHTFVPSPWMVASSPQVLHAHNQPPPPPPSMMMFPSSVSPMHTMSPPRGLFFATSPTTLFVGSASSQASALDSIAEVAAAATPLPNPSSDSTKSNETKRTKQKSALSSMFDKMEDENDDDDKGDAAPSNDDGTSEMEEDEPMKEGEGKPLVDLTDEQKSVPQPHPQQQPVPTTTAADTATTSVDSKTIPTAAVPTDTTATNFLFRPRMPSAQGLATIPTTTKLFNTATPTRVTPATVLPGAYYTLNNQTYHFQQQGGITTMARSGPAKPPASTTSTATTGGLMPLAAPPQLAATVGSRSESRDDTYNQPAAAGKVPSNSSSSLQISAVTYPPPVTSAMAPPMLPSTIVTPRDQHLSQQPLAFRSITTANAPTQQPQQQAFRSTTTNTPPPSAVPPPFRSTTTSNPPQQQTPFRSTTTNTITTMKSQKSSSPLHPQQQSIFSRIKLK